MRMTAGHRCLAVLGLAVIGVAVGARAASGGDLRLVAAAKNADWGTLRALIEQGADVNAPQGDGATALHWAVYRDEGESVDLLIRAGARVNEANDLGVTPLWLACENGSAAMVRRLLQAGATPHTALLSGETPLMAAARTGNPDVVQQLLAKRADVNAKERGRGQTALMWAVAQQHADSVEVLLAHGADVHARSHVWTQVVKTTTEATNPAYTIEVQQGGETPLLFAARVGNLASVKLLVAAGTDVNDTAPSGTSATVVAAHSRHGALAAFLLGKGADPNAAGAGYTALHAAILHKDEKLVGALLAHGANPNAPVQRATPARRDSTDFYLPPAFVGATPFWLAARYGAPRIMRLLAEHGANPLFVHHLEFWSGFKPDLVIEGDITALMAAAGMGARLPRAQDSNPGASEAAILEAVQMTAELGVDVNAANDAGNTALHTVAAQGYDSVVEFLVERGARLDARNKNGQTPLAVAAAGRGQGAMGGPPRKTTVELLRRLGAKE